MFALAAGSEVYRLNLEQGRFLDGIKTASEYGNNCVEINPVHQMIGVGGEDGVFRY